MLALLDAKDDNGLGEKRLALAKVALGIKVQPPPRRATDLAQGIGESTGARRRLPDLDAAIGVGSGCVDLGVDGAVVNRAFEAHGDALCWPAGGGVEDVTGDVVLCLGHDDDDVCVCACMSVYEMDEKGNESSKEMMRDKKCTQVTEKV